MAGALLMTMSPFLAVSRFRAAFLGLFALLWAVSAFSALATSQTPPAQDPAIRGVYGDWALRCDVVTGEPGEQCALVQNVYAEGKPDLQLVVIIKKAPDNTYLLRVVVPLGIILPAGLGLKIDGVDIGKTGFLRCLSNGCMAEVTMDDGLIGRFKSGTTALFIIFPIPNEGTGIPIALTGFANGFTRLN